MRKVLVFVCSFLFFVSFFAGTALFVLQNTLLRESFYTGELTSAAYPETVDEVSRVLYEKNELIAKHFALNDIRSAVEKSYPVENARGLFQDFFNHIVNEDNDQKARRFIIDLSHFKTLFERNLKSFLVGYLKKLPACDRVQDALDFSCLPLSDLSDESILVYIDSVVDLGTLTKDIPDSFSFEYPSQISDTANRLRAWQWSWIAPFPLILALLLVILLFRRKKSLARLSFVLWFLIGIFYALSLFALNTFFSYLNYAINESPLRSAFNYITPFTEFVAAKLHFYFMVLMIVSASFALISLFFWVYFSLRNKVLYGKKRGL